MAIKDRIKEARLNKHLTQEQVAKLIGVAKSTFTGYEKGNSEPNVFTISKILDALDVDANFLYQDEMKELQAYDQATPLEMEKLVKKYRDLDLHGKEMVDFTLLKEWERSAAEKSKVESIIPMAVREDNSYEVNAAHAIPNATEEDIQHDEDIMNSDDF